MIQCKYCGNVISQNATYCQHCGNSQQDSLSQKCPVRIEPDSLLCVNCGHLGHAKKKVKGSIATEALLLILSVLLALFNVALAGICFFVFVGYCVWRLSTKHKTCELCDNPNLIPATSPMASRYLNG